MKKLKQYEIEDPMFCANLSFLVGDRDLFNKKLKEWGDGLENNLAKGNGKTITDGKYFIVWVKEMDSVEGMGILLHELVHYVFFVLEARRVNISTDNDEVFAYYYAMVYRNIMSKIKK